MPNASVYYPRKSHHGYFDKALNQYFNSKSEKRDYLNAHKLTEDGSMESEKHRENRLVDEINHEREKAGLKTLTREQLVGDSKTR